MYVVARDDAGLGQSAIETIDIVTGAKTRLSTFDKTWLYGLALSPDERTLLVSLVESQGADLMLVEPAREASCTRRLPAALPDALRDRFRGWRVLAQPQRM